MSNVIQYSDHFDNVAMCDVCGNELLMVVIDDDFNAIAFVCGNRKDIGCGKRVDIPLDTQ